ncbi:hypothetical protein O3M35_000009 [Rhynocoris fuscipes]|uniref:Armadillo repeat-containing protein 2 n=1 Tax=Rhynocoris fuscipes TaxID=488301 RepID=A0AAW1DMR2_9HEMI
MDNQRVQYKSTGCLLKTSAEIIREARAEMSTRPVNTKRPFTPTERQRTLFGASRAGPSRPPSSISLRQVQFHDVETVKLPPLRNTPSANRMQSKLSWHLPEIGLRGSSSLSNLPEEAECDQIKDLWTNNNILRETHSSPQERTETLLKPKNLTSLNHSSASRERFSSTGFGNRGVFRRKYNYKLLGNRFDGKDSPSSVRNSIKETDENDDIQTLTINHKDINRHRLFRPPAISPLVRETLSEQDGTVEDNIINEKKAVENVVEDENAAIKQLLNQINELSDAESDEQKIEMIEKLYLRIKEAGNRMKSNQINTSIIKTLYKFVESASDALLLYISKVVLSLKVSGQNLSAVTKLIFKVSRSDKNDSMFLESDLLELFVESLGRASPIDDAEACIYGYGAIKFLTMNKQLLLVVLKLGILELMVLHLKIVNSARLDLLTIPEQTSHAMFQLTGALRNVASEDITWQYFVETGAIAQLCKTMELFSADLDLISNVARTISILSTHDACCESIIQCENSFRSITKIFNKYPGRQDIIVRFGYALGNIIAKSDAARIKLYKEPGALGAILNLLENYLEKDLEQMKSSSDNNNSLGQKSPDWASDGSIEDVIIKMVRIVANMSMHQEVGTGMTCLPIDDGDPARAVDHHNARDGGRFVDLLLMILRRKSVNESEELVMSTLSTLNNLSYYAGPESSNEGPFSIRQIEVTQVLSNLLLTKNEECMIEVTRVMGNLSRSKDVRDYILEIGGIGQLVRCLESENKELLFTTTGVLVNLMADWDKRLAFKESNGVQRLIVVLKTSGEGDWRLASLVCQALWNFCIDSTHLYAALGVQPTNNLLAVLVDLLDEERLFGISEGTEIIPDIIADTPEYRLWEEFASVATNLLEKIEQYLESLQAFEEK